MMPPNASIRLFVLNVMRSTYLTKKKTWKVQSELNDSNCGDFSVWTEVTDTATHVQYVSSSFSNERNVLLRSHVLKHTQTIEGSYLTLYHCAVSGPLFLTLKGTCVLFLILNLILLMMPVAHCYLFISQHFWETPRTIYPDEFPHSLSGCITTIKKRIK